MPQGWYGLICCICFEQLKPEECVIDREGSVWDAHPGKCAQDAGIDEAPSED